MSRRILILLSLFLATGARLSADGSPATVTLVEQPAQFSHDGIKYHKVKRGTALSGGDVLRTGETGRLVIRFVDGSQAAVASNTDVALRRLTPNEDPVRTTLSLLRGGLRALVKKLSSRSSFEVETYNTVVAVKGTDFEVDVVSDKDGKKKTVASCFETQGAGLEVSGLDRKDAVKVLAGMGTDNSTGKPEQAAVLRAQDLQKALEKYRGLTLQSIPPSTEKPGAQPLPAVTPSAAQVQAQAAFDAAARKSEAAVSNYLQAVDKGDLDAQAKAQADMSGLRDAAKSLEQDLAAQEDQVEKQLQDLKENPTPNNGADSKQQQEILQAQLDDLKQLKDTLKEVAQQSHLEQQADAAQGNLFMDKDGFRVQYNSTVTETNGGATIQTVSLSRRSGGPNVGQTEFDHVVTFNKPVGDDWVSVYERPLNDAGNLTGPGGFPDFWRVEEHEKTFSPNGDCVCLEQDLQTPQLDVNTYRQARQEFFQAIGASGGIAQGQRSYDYQGNLMAGSDNIQVTATDSGSALHLSYDNLGGPTGYVGNIFTIDVNLPGASPAIDSASLGSSLYAIANADLSGLTGNTAFEVTFRSPAYPGHEVSPLLDKNDFREAFREGWR